MCGIAGTVGLAPERGRMEKMLAQMAWRGPDGTGSWNDGAGTELGHRRLAIIDLATGQQPQVSPDGRYVLVLNGEIYNYLELRAPLEQLGWRFTTTSDTEVLLAGLALKGPDFVRETVGMFAFALWDNREKSLLIARDRMGIKPLYYAEPAPGQFVFASELKSILSLKEIPRRLNPAALELFLALRYVPGPHTMVEGVFKFPPAHWAFFKNGRLEFKRFWDIAFDSFDPAAASASAEDDRAAEERFADLLRDAVRLCMRADVDCGAFLSGGVDSTVVTGLMAGSSRRPVRTYSIGFGSVHDELTDAEKTAKNFGAVHTALNFEAADFKRLPEAVRFLDEPFSDPIALAMFLLAERAKRDVKVVLTGEGADELLGGYVHHPHFFKVQRSLNFVPQVLLKTAALGVKYVPIRCLDKAFAYPASIGSKGRIRLSGFLSAAKQKTAGYLAYVSLFQDAERRAVLSDDILAALPAPSALDGQIRKFMGGADNGRRIDEIFEAEYKTWLPDNILFKQDKTLMAHSIEGRVPYCDHRLVEFAAKLPMRFKMGGGANKKILRSTAARLFPKSILPAAKKAFMVPADGACGKAQMDLAREVLTGSKCRRRGIFRAGAVDRLMGEYASSPLLAGKQLMSLTMFELWMENVLES